MKNITLKLMDINDIINEYTEVKDILYRDERYSVRDNGAVLRHPKDSSKKRKLDSCWTFGLKDKRTGYMMIGNHRVHIIVASAFQGYRDSKLYVVDHIDTNRCNNRIENLRWLTKLENALNNPVTRKRIEYLCGGDIQMFINNPNCLRDLTGKYQDTTLQSATYRTATSKGNIIAPIYSIDFSPQFFHAKNDDKFAKNTL
jgi:hypothetical protein